MIVLSNNVGQTVAPGAAVTFTVVTFHTGNGECFNNNSVKLREQGIYQISYGANATGATAAVPVQLSLQMGGTTIPESTTIYTPAVANAVGNMSRTIAVRNCCCDMNRITLVNTGTAPITISANPILFIRRLS